MESYDSPICSDAEAPPADREILFGQDRKLLDPANKLAEKIRSLPADPAFPDREPRALLVGGFVRDALTGTVSKDADIEVYGVSPERLENVLQQLFPGKVDMVGRSFGVMKVFLGNGLDLDISIPRRESKTGKGHKDFAIEGDPDMTVKEAARRRDFTMNSIAADPLTGEILDPFGGAEDIKNRVLRVTDPERFQDDPLRVYRAVQLSARLNFTIEPKSFALMHEMVERGDLEALAPERVTEEWKKLLLKSEKPSQGFEWMRKLGILEKYYPELDAMIDVPQEPEWHPEGDVWTHTMMTLDEAAKIARSEREGLPFTPEERLQILLGALCHDLGKPSTTKPGEKDGIPRIRSLGHEEAGVEPTKQLLSRLTFGSDVEAAATAIASSHLKPSTFYRAWEKGELNDEQYANAVRKWIKRNYPISWRVLLAASEADSRGRALPGVQTDPFEPGEHLTRVVEERGLDKAPTQPLVQGRDLIALGLKPGPRFTEIIRLVEANRDAGKLTTKEDALAFVNKQL